MEDKKPNKQNTKNILTASIKCLKYALNFVNKGLM